MALTTIVDDRQIKNVAPLSGAIGSAANSTLSAIMGAVDSELTAPGSLDAQATPSLVISVASGTIVNPLNNKNRNLPQINGDVPNFPGGTITFPSSSGTITVSPGSSVSISIAASQFCAVLVQVSSAGLINLAVGTAVGSIGSASVPRGSSTALSLGYIIVQTDGSGTIQPIAESAIYQFVGGGGSGSGSGSGVDSPASGFQFLVSDGFSVSPASSGSNVNSTNTSASYQSSGPLYQIQCDKSKTITTSSTACTMSASPSFTVTPGCIVWSNSQSTWRKIITVTSQTVYVLDAAFPTSLTGDSGMVSQAVYSNDVTMIGDSTHQHRGIDIFPSTAVQQISISYQDSSTSGDAVFDAVSPAEVVLAACNTTTGGTSNGIPYSNAFSSIFTRSDAPSSIPNYPLGGIGQNLYLAFFANPNNSAVTALCNLLSYDCSLYAETVLNNGGYLNSAFTMTDGSGTSIDASASTPSTFTQITLTWAYVPGLNAGLPDGDLEVIIEGNIIPRYYSGVVGQYYSEITPNVIQLSANYSTSSYSVHVRRRQGSIDTSDSNGEFIFNLTGVLFPFGGSTAPTGFLLCDGTAYSRATYAALFNIIGTTYGVGDGSTTFNVPNTQGLFLRGAGTQTVGGISYSVTLGATQNDQMQGHYHNLGSGDAPATVNSGTGTFHGTTSWEFSNGTGSPVAEPITDGTNGTPRTGTESRPANLAVQYIIKY